VCWGLNDVGQCVVPADLPPAVAVDAGSFHSLALLGDGSVRAWGGGVPGASGYPHFGQSTIPAQLGVARQVSGGGYFSVGLSRRIADCPADLDANRVINGVDLAIILTEWGTDGGTQHADADIDASGSIDAGDLAAVLSAWGPCP